VPLVQGLVAIAVFGALHYANSFLGFKFPAFEQLTGGKPRELIKDGKMLPEAMAAEHVNQDELTSLLRENQIDDIQDVAVGTLETNGQLSVRKIPEAHELEKRDLNGRVKKGK
jgi:uncharacterized membrane protein YcaP (DUF421 family)